MDLDLHQFQLIHMLSHKVHPLKVRPTKKHILDLWSKIHCIHQMISYLATYQPKVFSESQTLSKE